MISREFHLFYDGAQMIRQQFFSLPAVMKMELGLDEFSLRLVVTLPKTNIS